MNPRGLIGTNIEVGISSSQGLVAKVETLEYLVSTNTGEEFPYSLDCAVFCRESLNFPLFIRERFICNFFL